MYNGIEGEKVKKILIGFMTCFLFLLTGCGGKEMSTVSYDELANKFKEKQSFILYLGSSNCSHCMEFRPTLDKVVSDYNLDVYYLNMAKISENQYKEISKKVNFEGTPSVLEVKNGEAFYTKRIVGVKDEEATIDYFKSIGAIK